MLGGTGGRCYVKGHVRLVRVSHLESIFLRDFLFDFVPTVEKAYLRRWSGNTDTVSFAYLAAVDGGSLGGKRTRRISRTTAKGDNRFELFRYGPQQTKAEAGRVKPFLSSAPSCAILLWRGSLCTVHPEPGTCDGAIWNWITNDGDGGSTRLDIVGGVGGVGGGRGM